MLTCCRRWGKKCDTAYTECRRQKKPTDEKLIHVAANHNKSLLPDTLRLAVLLNKKEIAALIWYTCSNPMSKIVTQYTFLQRFSLIMDTHMYKHYIQINYV